MWTMVEFKENKYEIGRTQNKSTCLKMTSTVNILATHTVTTHSEED